MDDPHQKTNPNGGTKDSRVSRLSQKDSQRAKEYQQFLEDDDNINSLKPVSAASLNIKSASEKLEISKIKSAELKNKDNQILSESEMDSFADDFDEKIDKKSYNDVLQKVKEMDDPSDSESDGGILSDELDERSYTPVRRNPMK